MLLRFMVGGFDEEVSSNVGPEAWGLLSRNEGSAAHAVYLAAIADGVTPRRAIGSPESDVDPWGHAQRAFVPGQQSLLTREQQEQLRMMERRAPLLYGRPQRVDRGHDSSGGSTYEAVQDEVRKQLRGVVEQLEASRQEADELRQEVVKLRAGQGEGVQEPQREHLVQPRGPPQSLGGYLAGSSTTGASGLHAGASIAALPSGTTTSGLHARASTSGVVAGSSTAGASGLQAGATMSTVPAALPMSGLSGLQRGEEGVNARTFTSATMGGPTGTTMEASSAGHGAGDPMARLLEGDQGRQARGVEQSGGGSEACGDLGQFVSGLW